jgi:hypothetical protein
MLITSALLAAMADVVVAVAADADLHAAPDEKAETFAATEASRAIMMGRVLEEQSGWLRLERILNDGALCQCSAVTRA